MLVYGFLKLLSILKNKENKENVWFSVFITKKYKKKPLNLKNKEVFSRLFVFQKMFSIIVFKNVITKQYLFLKII